MFLVDWRQRNSTFFNALQVERNVMFLILTMIVLVAALNIVSGLIMLVKDKGQDIAILRTMGASQGSIMRIFLITGAAIGVVGTLTGFFVGMLICLNIESIRQFLSWLTSTELFDPTLYFLSKLPAEIDVGETAAVVVMALTLSFLATLYPSWRAARRSRRSDPPASHSCWNGRQSMPPTASTTSTPSPSVARPDRGPSCAAGPRTRASRCAQPRLKPWATSGSTTSRRASPLKGWRAKRRRSGRWLSGCPVPRGAWPRA